MILVMVGTHSQAFDRLVKVADELGSELDERLIIQCGTSEYTLRNAEGFRWAPQERILELIASSRVVITHAAAGSIIQVLREGKPLVLVPRLKQYKEHFDDHQLQLARALEARGRAVVVYNLTVTALQEAIHIATQKSYLKEGLEIERPSQLVTALRQQLEKWDGWGLTEKSRTR